MIYKVLRQILTVTTLWNTGETGDIYSFHAMHSLLVTIMFQDIFIVPRSKSVVPPKTQYHITCGLKQELFQSKVYWK